MQACHHSNSLPWFIVLVISQDVLPSSGFSFGAVERAVPVRALLSDGAPSAPSLPSAASSVEALRHREGLHTLMHACKRSQVGRCLNLSSLFD